MLKRVHAGQASLRRSDLQESFQRQVALREIARLAPELGAEEAELAWRLGSGRGSPEGAVRAYAALLAAFERLHGTDAEVRDAAARVLLRARSAAWARPRALAIPSRLALGRARRRREESRVRGRAATWLEGLTEPSAPFA